MKTWPDALASGSEAASVAVSVTTGGSGTVAGAVYRPVDVTVPTVELPPAIPFTLHEKLMPGFPLSVAANCRVVVIRTTSPGGSRLRTPMTLNDVGELPAPRGVVTRMSPVVAPAGTFVTRRFGAAAVTRAAVPLKVTVFWLAVAENPLPKIWTTVSTRP